MHLAAWGWGKVHGVWGWEISHPCRMTTMGAHFIASLHGPVCDLHAMHALPMYYCSKLNCCFNTLLHPHATAACPNPMLIYPTSPQHHTPCTPPHPNPTHPHLIALPPYPNSMVSGGDVWVPWSWDKVGYHGVGIR